MRWYQGKNYNKEKTSENVTIYFINYERYFLKIKFRNSEKFAHQSCVIGSIE